MIRPAEALLDGLSGIARQPLASIGPDQPWHQTRKPLVAVGLLDQDWESIRLVLRQIIANIVFKERKQQFYCENILF